jgi:hypothetical protein
MLPMRGQPTLSHFPPGQLTNALCARVVLTLRKGRGGAVGGPAARARVCDRWGWDQALHQCANGVGAACGCAPLGMAVKLAKSWRVGDLQVQGHVERTDQRSAATPDTSTSGTPLPGARARLDRRCSVACFPQ